MTFFECWNIPQMAIPFHFLNRFDSIDTNISHYHNDNNNTYIDDNNRNRNSSDESTHTVSDTNSGLSVGNTLGHDNGFNRSEGPSFFFQEYFFLYLMTFFSLLMNFFRPLYSFFIKKVHGWLINILRQGPIPTHVAFIMDGNRRYAKRHGLLKNMGHLEGFKKLEEILQWSLEIGIRCVTVYAFSIENFRRSADEVNFLMDLAIKKFSELSKHNNLIHQHQVAIRVIGNLNLLRPDVREAALNAMELTKNYSKYCLNIACPYTSSEEILSAIKMVKKELFSNIIKESAITEEYLEKKLYTAPIFPHVDILIRPSGQQRLSDFLLWQATKDCRLYFLKVLWPEMTFLDLFFILLSYQSKKMKSFHSI